MNVFKFDALLKVDKEKYADYVLSEIDQTYAMMLDQGATSFWETELGEADFDNAGSLCHGWSAIPVYYYHILGENGKKQPTLDKPYLLTDNPMREEYRDSIKDFIKQRSLLAQSKRDKVLELPLEERRQLFLEMLGYPLVNNADDSIKLLYKEKVLSTSKIIVER